MEKKDIHYSVAIASVQSNMTISTYLAEKQKLRNKIKKKEIVFASQPFHNTK